MTLSGRSIRQAKRGVRALYPVVALSAAVLLSSCAFWSRSPHGSATAPRSVSPDSGVVIVGVRNFEEREMIVFMDAVSGRWRLGTVPGMHESLFVLPSSSMEAVQRFVIAVIPVGSAIYAYQTDFITRTPGKVLVVGIQVGAQEPGPHAARPRA